MWTDAVMNALQIAIYKSGYLFDRLQNGAIWFSRDCQCIQIEFDVQSQLNTTRSVHCFYEIGETIQN